MKGLIIIDMVNDFIEEGKDLEVPEGREIIPNIENLIREARDNDIPVIYSKDSHTRGDDEFEDWPPHSLEGTEGSEVIKELKPEEEDIIIKKHSFSSFRGTELEERLKSLGIDEIILVGVLTDICILHAAIDAYYKDYEVIVPEDCVATVSQKKQEIALDHIENVLGFDVVKSEEVI